MYSGFFLPEQHSRKIELLKKKADDGASIRILLGDPDCPQVAVRGGGRHRRCDRREDPQRAAGLLPAVCRSPGINIRLHCTTLYNSIYWFDDDMLVNTHAYGLPAHSPVLHLRHQLRPLFEPYARSCNRVWDQTRRT